MNNCNELEISKIEIKLKRDNLLYDIAQRGFISADAIELKNNENQHIKSHMKDIVEDGNVDVIIRTIEDAYSRSLLSLSDFICDCNCCDDSDSETITMTNDYDDYRDYYCYRLTLNEPKTRARLLCNRLTSLLHNYIVFSAIEQFTSVATDSLSQRDNYYRQQSEDCLQEIVALLSMNNCSRSIVATE